jgi:hypothetical protein
MIKTNGSIMNYKNIIETIVQGSRVASKLDTRKRFPRFRYIIKQRTQGIQDIRISFYYWLVKNKLEKFDEKTTRHHLRDFFQEPQEYFDAFVKNEKPQKNKLSTLKNFISRIKEHQKETK